MKSNRNAVIAFLVSCIFACTTTPQRPVNDPLKHSRATASPPESSSTNAVKVGNKRSTSPLSLEAEYAAFFARMSSRENDYTEKDRQILNNMAPNPSGGTVHEAALTVGILRDVLTPVGTNGQFQGVDGALPQINTGKTRTTPTGADSRRQLQARSLEVRGREKGLDIIAALSSNTYLKSLDIYRMTLDALNIGGNSPIFLQNTMAVLREEAQHWQDFARIAGVSPQPLAPTNSTQMNSAQPQVEDNNVAVTSPSTPSPIPADLSGENSLPTKISEPNSEAARLLAKAQELASKDKIDQAINEAKKVPEGSENYTAARQNIKIWSDRATQDLRKQAAQHFRSSSAAPDASGKRIYLSKARSLLEEAINKYPDSSNLETIKENLDIINQELGRLE